MHIPVTDKKLAGKSILVAEDVEMNQQLIRHILESGGANVVIAADGVKAVDLVKEQTFDCILMDVQMPEMDGIQATLCIRKLEDRLIANIPIIALTANCTPEDLLKYEAAGMNDYLPKPIVEADLIDTILGITRSAAADIQTKNAAGNKLYDLTMIRSVSGGDETFIRKMIMLFIETVPLNVQELVDSTRSHNWEQVSKMAHKLKSTIDSMGIRTIHECIRTVELNAKNQPDPELLTALVSQVESVVSSCVEQLRQEING